VDYQKIIVDHPLPRVQRITLNRPEKRNPLSNELRSELFHALESADQNPDLRVTIIRGAGSCFSAGYDLTSDVSKASLSTRRAGSATGRATWSRASSTSGISPSR
jgi:enoyl-CoA hydratase